MTSGMSLLSLVLFPVGLTCVGVAAVLWRGRRAGGVTGLLMLLMALAVWSLGYGLEINGHGLQAKLLWARIEYVGITVVPVAIVVFALEHTGRRAWSAPSRMALLLALPVAMVAAVWTNDMHHLVWATVKPAHPGRPLVLGHGPAFFANSLYAYGLMLVATFLIIADRWPLRSSFRLQTFAVVVALATPWLLNVPYVMGLLPWGFDLTPLAFGVTALGLLAAHRQWGLLDLAPVSRHGLIDELADGIVVLDGCDRIVDANRAAGPVLSCPIDEAIGRSAGSVLQAGLNIDAAAGRLGEVQTPAGPRTYEVDAVAVATVNGRAGRLLMFRDVTAREHVHALLRAEALTDDLTQLANRRAFLESVRQEVGRRDRRDLSLGVLFVDLDDFKGINDTFGHHAGDTVLAATARRLVASVRAEDVAARIGGDEFAILVPGIEGPDVPRAIAARIASALREPVDVEGRPITVSATLGLHVTTPGDATPESLLEAADRRMYLAKRRRMPRPTGSGG